MAFGSKQFHCEMSCDHELAMNGHAVAGKTPAIKQLLFNIITIPTCVQKHFLFETDLKVFTTRFIAFNFIANLALFSL